LKEAPLVSIVEDADVVACAIAGLAGSDGYAAATFDCAETFLASGRSDETVYLICDVHSPGVSGLAP
jgi:FixJ family two-component response regulator